MKDSILLNLPRQSRQKIWAHLLPRTSPFEQAAFLYARFERVGAVSTFDVLDWSAIEPSGFAAQFEDFIEVSDEARASAIKRAHDLHASLIEIHSHRTHRQAGFSLSDVLGLSEFVPHVWWRLKNRPYLAVVVAESSFDGLAWTKDPSCAERLDGIVTDGRLTRSTGLSSLSI